MKCNRIIREMAKKNGVSEQTVRSEMQKALDEAWNSTDPSEIEKQKELFPAGKPTLDEFIEKISRAVIEN